MVTKYHLLRNKKCQWLMAFEEFISFSGLKYLAVLFYQSPVNFNPHSIFFFSHQWSLWSITLNCTHKDSKYRPVQPTQLLRLLKESLECIWFQVKLFDFGIFTIQKWIHKIEFTLRYTRQIKGLYALSRSRSNVDTIWPLNSLFNL